MGGSDCEVVGDGLLAQPVNTWSSGAFLVASAYVLVRSRHSPPSAGPPLVLGAIALVLVALGSAAFHGPQPAWADVAHDGSIAALLLVYVLRDPGGGGTSRLLVSATVLAAALAVLAVRPGAEAVVHAPLVGAAAVVELRRSQAGLTDPSWSILAASALVAGVVLLVLGRTGGPLCAPASLAQAHAGWHVLSAVGAAALLAAGRPRAPATTS